MRYPVAVVIAAFSAMLVLSTAERGLPAGAADKTADTLKKEVSQLQGQVKQLQTTNTGLQNTNTSLQTAINGYKGAGLIHVVILKVKPDSFKTSDSPSKSKANTKLDPKTEVNKIIDDAYSQLAKINGVRGLWAGKPSTTGAPEANTDYSVGLVLAFDDASGLKNYLNDSAHTKFADKHMKYYDTPFIFDLEPRKPQP